MFALFAVLASFGIGNMTQANSISSALNETVGFSKVAIGVVLTLLSLAVIVGGIKSISKVSSVVVPENLGKLHSVGRLDCDTSGLLLFTTNGSFSHKAAAPDFKIEKKYFVRLEKTVEETGQAAYKRIFEEGVVLPAEKKAAEQKALPAALEFLSDRECVVAVREGRFHQIKRMFMAVENRVEFLKRIQFGNLKLDENLLPGQFRFVDAEEF